ncbi:hypothetical protein JAAARDRAFT_30550 [Jaapia argillacea MUCL 33604]|uniref:Peptidase A1 domain-containing protein n=1 Tax=Jaapia argillacea MUCL 33604 TaxID=933084 RepID=A0A067Q6F5_9AGAM|nr:hypothetical protein JAAARDRAFT_30550 [Jaapia argillacea MUCL 33604]
MKGLPVSLISSLLIGLDFVAALHLNLEGRRYAGELAPALLQRRGNIFGQSTLNNSQDVGYYANINVGGAAFQVLIDTGSSDLWVAGTVPTKTSTGATSGVQYAIGSVTGPINLATLEFAGYSVPSQAYLEITPDDTNPSGSGLIGLGPNTGSNIWYTLNGEAQADAVCDRIFRMNTTTPNFISVLLGRSNDSSQTWPGDLTVGEIVSGYEAISAQPKLNVSQVSIYDLGDQHWQTLLDPNGVIGPDGNPIAVTTGVNTTTDPTRLTAVFDSGFTLPQVPPAVAAGIYQNITGAKLQDISGLGSAWTLPCNVPANVTFKFGGMSFPVHPLDLSSEGFQLSDGSCLGSFQPIGSTAQSPNYDMILGMAFLRNVYMLINFGDFVDGSTKSTAAPYIQLLSTTNDSTQALKDFDNARKNGFTNTPSSGSSGSSTKSPWTSARTIELTIGLIVIGLIFSGISYFVKRRKQQNYGGGLLGKIPYGPVGGAAPPQPVELVGQYQPPPPPPGGYNPYNPYDGQQQPAYQPYAPPQGPPPGQYGPRY